MSISSNIPTAAKESQADFGDRISTLERRVELLESIQPKPRNRNWPPPPELVERIKEITRATFRSEAVVEIDCDPSEPDDPWMNFDVSCELDYRELRKLAHQWHEAVYELGVADASRFRVIISRR